MEEAGELNKTGRAGFLLTKMRYENPFFRIYSSANYLYI